MTQATKREDRRIKANLVTHGKLMSEYIDLGIARDVASKLAYRDMQSNAAKWTAERDELVAALRALFRAAELRDFDNCNINDSRTAVEWAEANKLARAALAKVQA